MTEAAGTSEITVNIYQTAPQSPTCIVHVMGGGQHQCTGFVEVKYGGSFVGPKAATVAVKALQEPGEDGRTGSGEVNTGLASH
jgi:hypothetical protein